MCLELIARHLPWVRNTYILTARGQVPSCVTDEIVVHHDEVGLGAVFNSHAIEAALHKIPHLSEHFLYFNDDVYVTKPLQIRHFFREGKPVVQFETLGRDHDTQSTQWTQWTQWTAALENTMNRIGVSAGDDGTMPALVHAPYPLTRSIMNSAESRHLRLWNATKRCKLRYTCGDDEIAPVFASLVLAVQDGRALRAGGGGDDDAIRIAFTSNLPNSVTDEVRQAHIVCVNNLDGNREDLRNFVIHLTFTKHPVCRRLLYWYGPAILVACALLLAVLAVLQSRRNRRRLRRARQ